jgi:uncharacterized membrane protein
MLKNQTAFKLFLTMSRESIVFTAGILLLVVPSLGIPESWKFYFYIASGVVLVVVGYSLRRSAYLRSIQKENGEQGTDSFVEHVVKKEKPDRYV